MQIHPLLVEEAVDRLIVKKQKREDKQKAIRSYYNSSRNDPLAGLPLDELFCVDGAYNTESYIDMLHRKERMK